MGQQPATTGRGDGDGATQFWIRGFQLPILGEWGIECEDDTIFSDEDATEDLTYDDDDDDDDRAPVWAVRLNY